MKLVTYTSMHFTVAFTVAWVLTGDILVGGLVALVEPAINSVAYVLHEKLWARWRGAQQKVMDSSQSLSS